MHALGNDFIIIDQTQKKYNLNSPTIKQLANRHTGIGFDQLLIIEKSRDIQADFYCRIFNADASEVSQCGNGVRCFARFVYEKGLSNKKHLRILTKTGLMLVDIADDKTVRVNMGLPSFKPTALPFIADKTQLTYQLLDYKFGIASMGNPHCTLLVDDINAIDVAHIGALLMNNQHFPEQVNVGFMQIIDRHHIKLRVYERGVGETLACGSGACAAVTYGVRLGQLDNTVTVHLKGGNLEINYFDNQAVFMQGEAVFVFDGKINIKGL